MQSNRAEHAVSEVIGTVLIIALVVALAGIIGAMVFGLVGNLQNTKIVGVTATRFNATNITVTYAGGQNSGQLYWVNISTNGIRTGQFGNVGSKTPVTVGNSTLVAGNSPGKDHVVVVGAFSDGTEQVILDTTV